VSEAVAPVALAVYVEVVLEAGEELEVGPNDVSDGELEAEDCLVAVSLVLLKEPLLLTLLKLVVPVVLNEADEEHELGKLSETPTGSQIEIAYWTVAVGVGLIRGRRPCC
jgi:hypothetical protein